MADVRIGITETLHFEFKESENLRVDYDGTDVTIQVDDSSINEIKLSEKHYHILKRMLDKLDLMLHENR